MVYTAWLSARLARRPSLFAAVILGIVLASAIIANPRGATILPARPWPCFSFATERHCAVIFHRLAWFMS